MKPVEKAADGSLDPREYEDALDLTRRARKYFGDKLGARMDEPGKYELKVTMEVAKVYAALLDREIMLDTLKSGGRPKGRPTP